LSLSKPMKIPISYITGEVRLEFIPPHGFSLEPKVDVDGVPSHLAPLEGGTATAWIFLGLVPSGAHKVTCAVGNVIVSQDIVTRDGTIVHADFYFEKGS
jgi:hypothetical protein